MWLLFLAEESGGTGAEPLWQANSWMELCQRERENGQNLKSLKNLGARVHSRNLRHQRTREVVNLHESQ